MNATRQHRPSSTSAATHDIVDVYPGNPGIMKAWTDWSTQERILHQLSEHDDDIDVVGRSGQRRIDLFEDSAIKQQSIALERLESLVSLSFRDVLIKMRIWQAHISAGSADYSHLATEERLALRAIDELAVLIETEEISI